jgi:hypothetical protein
MNTNRTTRFAGLLLAVLMTLAINGVMLLKFDSVARQEYAGSARTPTVVTLGTVNVVAQRT